MELLKLLNANEVMAQVVNFLLLLFLLRIFFWRRILKLLDGRRARIASELKYIDDTKGDVEKLKSDLQTKINTIEDIAKSKIHQAVQEGKAEAGRIREDAHSEAENIIQTAKQQITYEIDKAKEKLRQELIDITIRTAENVIGEKLTGERDKKLVEDFLEQIDKPQ